ncbi:MAG: DUF3300 domain-containing protein [Candidatus Pseudomonas phytovorans]|uniref:DUF3300 domain-containing protein n=1 Tax=Candidatus Pseudomonas phytovorans TaxID=3121377 RepID=A0AAJ6B8C9_9PSED|nr:DUF3300 domain-containing protein [Pseudomonas sp.]WEK28220.1 MAG: DUF3300 domain-containing protein [Pseudomonas sp.]
MRMPLFALLSALMCLNAAPGLARAQDAPAPDPVPQTDTVAAKTPVFTQAQLDQMLAPVALYPDPLLAQVLMAATYPGQVSEAVAWSKANPKASGDAAVKQVAKQPWDPSVQALVAFPQLLATLGQDPVWVQRLGDAFLAQPDDVMGAVQRLRHQAQAAGNLQSNQYQNVTVQAAPVAQPSSSPASTIIIQPADPQVVYVPSYNPTTIYGTWAYPASPPVYYPPPPMYSAGSALVAGLAFGTGVAVVASLWGDCDWGHNDIDIDVNRYNNINVNNRITNNQNKWQHNAANREGVPYRDARSRQQYGRQLDGATQRNAFRGDDAQRAQARDKARASMDRAGMERPATDNRQARQQMREAQAGNSLGNRMQPRGDNAGATERRQETRNAQARQVAQNRPANSAGRARNNAFDGVGSPSRTSLQANRGRTSQAFAQRPNASRAAGHQISRPSAPMRHGGGGRR